MPRFGASLGTASRGPEALGRVDLDGGVWAGLSVQSRSKGPHGDQNVHATAAPVMDLTITCFGELRVEVSGRVVTHELPGRQEHALERGDARAALENGGTALRVLSRPLLPSLSGDWIEVARAGFEDVRVRALHTVARAGLAEGGAAALSAAEDAAAALVDLQPFREDCYSLLMDAQARRGNAAEALRTFERLRSLLREELGATPSPEVLAVHERVLRGQVSRNAPPAGLGGNATGVLRSLPVPAVTPRTAEGSFVGREACLAQLRGRWIECRDGQTNLVLLVGDPGIGKTRLAARFAEDVHAEGGAVLYGRVDAEALLPYQPFAEALEHLIAHAGREFVADAERELAILARSFPGLEVHRTQAAAPVDGDSLRYQIFEAVVSLLTRASARWPLVVVLDDLHWADKPTLLLLQYLLRHADRRRLLVIGTFRPVDVPRDHPLKDVLSDLRRDRRYDRLDLGGLDEEATRALIVDRLRRQGTDALVSRLHRQTEGNAFFIEETVRALEGSGLPSDALVDVDALEGLGVPEGVEEVILRRVSNLSQLAEEILMAGSVVGRSFRLGIVEHLVSDSPDQVMTAVEDAMMAGLVLEVAGEVDVFTFSHALVREVLYAQFSATRRVDFHHKVALALERLAEREPVNPAELAYHYHEARNLAGPGPARTYSLAAGRRAAELFAYEEAVAHYRRALGLFDVDDERDRCEAFLALGRVEWHAGDDNARHTFMDAAKSAQRRGATDQLAGAALGLGERYFEVTYLGSRYRELLEGAISAIGPEDSPQRALLLVRLAVNLAFPNESDAGHRLAEEGVAIARRLGDEMLLAAVLLARHVTLLDVRHLEQRLELSRELGLLASGHRELAAERHHWRMYDLLEAGELAGARDEQRKLETLADELGQPLFRCLAYGGGGLWGEPPGDVQRRP